MHYPFHLSHSDGERWLFMGLKCCGFAIVVSISTTGLFAPLFLVQAKSPGETLCYKEICHRVKTIAEIRKWVGIATPILTTYYDHPSIDRFNTGKYTSSGEVFDADHPTRASSSNLPDGTELLVHNPLHGRAIQVLVNHFGPFHTTRQLDLTWAGAQALGFVDRGVLRLDAIVVTPLPAGAPRYKRNRRYPAALGYVGILDDQALYAPGDCASRMVQVSKARSSKERST